MPIEINGHPAAGAAGGDAGEVRRAEQAKSQPARPRVPDPTPPPGPGQDAVSLTESAAQLKRLEAELGSRPVVDTQKVAEIRAAIAGGGYEVDTRRVADRMVQTETDLFGVQKPGAK